MENRTFTKQNYLEKDILDLLKRASEERVTKDVRKEAIPNFEIPIEDKNYSSYRKLIDSLRKLINTYEKIINKNHNKEFIELLLSRINQEIEELHKIKSDSLRRKNDEQYRCIIDCYTRLVEAINDIERRMPSISTQDNKNKLTYKNIQLSKSEREICSWAYDKYYKNRMEDKEITRKLDCFISDIGNCTIPFWELTLFIRDIIKGVIKNNLIHYVDIKEDVKMKTNPLNVELEFELEELRIKKSEVLAQILVNVLERINTYEGFSHIRGELRTYFAVVHESEILKIKITGLDIMCPSIQ